MRMLLLLAFLTSSAIPASAQDIPDDDDFWSAADTSWHWEFRARTRGTFESQRPWPEGRPGLAPHSSPIRYNRVEGFYIGAVRAPLTVTSAERSRLHGEIGYAFGLQEPRYTIGLDLRLTPAMETSTVIGGYYRRGTHTEDDWKIHPIENSATAFFARMDAFNYYETEGWSLGVLQGLGPNTRFAMAYRDEDHRSLAKTVTWSMFGGQAFRDNPAVDSLNVRAMVATLQTGSVRDVTNLPDGNALRIDVEWASGLGGDADYRRIEADARIYRPLSYFSGIAARIRGGTSAGDGLPLQKLYTLGGPGTVRGYPLHAQVGTRYALASLEAMVVEPEFLADVFGDASLLLFSDLGWAGDGAIAQKDLMASAGLGLGLDGRAFRLELAWPLQRLTPNQQMKPQLWVRFAPNF